MPDADRVGCCAKTMGIVLVALSGGSTWVRSRRNNYIDFMRTNSAASSAI